MILKEIFQLSDVELLGSIYFDKPPISINTFTNFRVRVYAYEEETGIDLIKVEVESLSNLIAEKLEIGDEKEVFTVKFAKETCSICSFKERCIIQFQKKINTVRINRSRYLRDIIRKKMDTKEYV